MSGRGNNSFFNHEVLRGVNHSEALSILRDEWDNRIVGSFEYALNIPATIKAIQNLERIKAEQVKLQYNEDVKLQEEIAKREVAELEAAYAMDTVQPEHENSITPVPELTHEQAQEQMMTSALKTISNLPDTHNFPLKNN